LPNQLVTRGTTRSNLSALGITSHPVMKVFDFLNFTGSIAHLGNNTLPERRGLNRKPTVYTFFDDLGGKTGPDRELRTWERSWQDAGWNTRVLSLKMAEDHGKMSKMTSMLDSTGSKLNTYERMCFYRWVAMAHQTPREGGWMTDIDVLPLHIGTDEGIDLPFDGKFTCHAGNIPALMSGSKSEWNRMLGLLLDTWQYHEGYLSDMHLLGTVLSKYGREAAHIIPSMVEVYPGWVSKSIGKVDCRAYNKDIKVIHFSHASGKNAFFGGWLEAGVRKKYGNNTSFSVSNNGVLVTKNADGTAYEHIEGKVENFDVVVDNEKFALHQIIGQNRGLLADLFMENVVKQCS